MAASKTASGAARLNVDVVAIADASGAAVLDEREEASLAACEAACLTATEAQLGLQDSRPGASAMGSLGCK